MAEPLLDRIVGRQAWLDRLGDTVQQHLGNAVRRTGRPGRLVKDLLHGTWLGHPFHPAVVELPIGAWGAGLVADYAAHFTSRIPTQAGDLALVVGWLAAWLATASGTADALETYGHERRLATLHALLMDLAVTLDGVSLLLRWVGPGGAHPAAVGLATAGYTIVLAGGYVGGHLVYGLGTGVNRHAFSTFPDEFVPVGTPSDFPEGDMRQVDVDGASLLVVRHHGRLFALADTCSHAGGPLHEGSLEGDVVVCPWHGSRFSLLDGGLRGGPATFPQPAFEVREEADVVAVRAARNRG